jgi:hypothetical protein
VYEKKLLKNKTKKKTHTKETYEEKGTKNYKKADEIYMGECKTILIPVSSMTTLGLQEYQKW